MLEKTQEVKLEIIFGDRWRKKVGVHFVGTIPDNDLKQGVCLNGRDDDDGAEEVQVCGKCSGKGVRCDCLVQEPGRSVTHPSFMLIKT